MDTETAPILPSNDIAEKVTERSGRDASRKHQTAVLKNMKTALTTASKRTSKEKNQKTTSRKLDTNKTTSVCRGEEAGSQKRQVRDDTAEEIRFTNSKGARNTASLKTKSDNKNKKDNLTEPSVPAKKRRKQAGTTTDKTTESVAYQKQAIPLDQLESVVVATTSNQNAVAVDGLQEQNQEQKDSYAKVAARKVPNQSTKNSETDTKKQDLDAEIIFASGEKSSIPFLLSEQVVSEISNVMKNARDFIHKIWVHQNSFIACLKLHCGKCGQADSSNFPLRQRYRKGIYENQAFIVDNYFNKSFKNMRNATAKRLCQDVEKLLKRIFEKMKDVERNRYLLLCEIQTQIDKHTFCAGDLAFLLKLIGLQQSIIDASGKALDALRQLAQLCLQTKQIASFFDFFSEELKPDSLLKFCTFKEAVCSDSNDHNIYDDFDHLKIANKSPYGLQANLEIVISPDVSSAECQLEWSYPINAANKLSELPCTLEVWNGVEFSCHLIPGGQTIYSVSLDPGRKYQIKLAILGRQGRLLASGELEGKAAFSTAESQSIYEKALTFVGDCEPTKFEILHRCNPKEAFESIKADGYIMRKHRKDYNGHNASPINGHLYGLFFYGCLINGCLPKKSPFGEYRLEISSLELLDPQNNNFYFADFYCNTAHHYVTIVVCKKGSKEDEFCRSNLIQLDAKSNKFLRVTDQSTCVLMEKVKVEIFYTESIDISQRTLSKVKATGNGKALPDGLPHNKTCTTCNLCPVTRVSKLNETMQKVYQSARSLVSDYATASYGNADFFFYFRSLDMMLQLFNGIRAANYTTGEPTIASSTPNEVLQQAFQMLSELGEKLLRTLCARLAESLKTAEQSFKDCFDTFESFCHELRDCTEEPGQPDGDQQRNQFAKLSVSSGP